MLCPSLVMFLNEALGHDKNKRIDNYDGNKK